MPNSLCGVYRGDTPQGPVTLEVDPEGRIRQARDIRNAVLEGFPTTVPSKPKLHIERFSEYKPRPDCDESYI